MNQATAIMGIKDSERVCRRITYRREKEGVGPLVDKKSK